VDLAGKQKGVYGARMTGGGFGGCTINLVEAAEVEAFRAAVSHGYQEASGRHPRIYVSEAAGGGGEVR
jgi:galactokinase